MRWSTVAEATKQNDLHTATHSMDLEQWILFTTLTNLPACCRLDLLLSTHTRVTPMTQPATANPHQLLVCRCSLCAHQRLPPLCCRVQSYVPSLKALSEILDGNPRFRDVQSPCRRPHIPTEVLPFRRCPSIPMVSSHLERV